MCLIFSSIDWHLGFWFHFQWLVHSAYANVSTVGLGNVFTNSNSPLFLISALFCCEGFRHPPIVNFPRRALTLPFNTSYANLTALLTVTNSPSDIQHFPHLQAFNGNSTGTTQTKRFDFSYSESVEKCNVTRVCSFGLVHVWRVSSCPLNSLPSPRSTASLSRKRSALALKISSPCVFVLLPVFPAFPLFAFLCFHLRTLLSSEFLMFPAGVFPLPIGFTFIYIFFFYFNFALICRERKAVGADSCCSHLCSPVGQWWRGATGEQADHRLHPPAGWQWPQGEWWRPSLEIWPTVGYVLTETSH